VELYPHFYFQLRLHVVVLNKAQAEHQLHRVLSGGTEVSRGVIWTGKILLVQRHDGKKRTTGRPRRRQDNIKTNLQEIGTVSNGLIWYSNIRGILNKDATLHSLFISGNRSTCFGCYFHPSSGAHKNCIYSIWYLSHCNGYS